MDEATVLRPTVGAVIVAHEGAVWLPKVLSSFASMSVAPNAWHAVDVASTDGSADLLRESLGASRISYAPSGTGFGDAVRMALEHLPPTEWLWLLHDDAMVLPSTLSGLLDEAVSADDIAIVGPKIREWPSLRRLAEIGVTITGTGSRETGLEAGEPDAGQHDRPRTVLAVSTAGMLVRRDVWDELGGLDPDLPMFFDDIDFGWRASSAGYRVRTASAGIVFHAEASRRGIRRRTAGDVPTWEYRRAALHTLLANTPHRRFAWQYVRSFFGTLLRVLGFLAVKDPESASDELLALRAVYLHPRRLRAARRSRAPFVRRPFGEIAELLPPFWLPYRHGLDAAREAVMAMVRPESVQTVGRHSSSPDFDDEIIDRPSLLRRRPWFAVVLLLSLFAVVASRSVLGGELHAPALAPAPDTAGGWWSLILARGHDVGLPSAAIGPSFALVLAVVATPLWFTPGLVITVLLLGAVPLAALTAHRLGRRLSDRRPVRIIWAVSYGLLVVGTGAVAQGRIGTVVVLVVAPIVVNVALQIAEEPRWQSGVRLGLWIAVAAAFAPISYALALLVLAAMLALAGRRVGLPVVVAAVVPLVLLGPWVLQRVLHPWRVWWEAGHPVPGTATILDVVNGTGGGPGAAPPWFAWGVLVVAMLALVPRGTRREVSLAWAAALAGLAAAVLALVVRFDTPLGRADVVPWAGLGAGLWLGGLLTAVLLAAPSIRGLGRPATAVLAALVLVLPVGLGGWWIVRGVDGPLADTGSSVVPAYLAERPGDTLVLTGSVADGVDLSVVSGSGPHLGHEAVLIRSATSQRVTDAVRGLLAAPSSADVASLAAAGIDAIYVPDADPELASRIDAAPALAPAGGDRPGSRVWTLEVEREADEEPRAGVWRWGLGIGQIAAWFVALVLTAPVRRREHSEALAPDPSATPESIARIGT